MDHRFSFPLERSAGTSTNNSVAGAFERFEWQRIQGTLSIMYFLARELALSGFRICLVSAKA